MKGVTCQIKNQSAPTFFHVFPDKKKRRPPSKTQEQDASRMAVPICTSWFHPAAVAAVASHGARPTSRAVHVHPLCRRGPSPAPLRIQDRTRDALRPHCHRHRMREPEPESDDDEPEVVSTKIRCVDQVRPTFSTCYFRKQASTFPLSTMRTKTRRYNMGNFVLRWAW